MKKLSFFSFIFLLGFSMSAVADFGTTSAGTYPSSSRSTNPSYFYSQTFMVSRYHSANSQLIEGIDTRVSVDNPSVSAACNGTFGAGVDHNYNPYLVLLSDGATSITIPSAGTYLITVYYMFYQNQSGYVNINMDLWANCTVYWNGFTMNGGNAAEYSQALSYVLTLNSGDVIKLRIYNNPSNQAYMLIGGGITIRKY